MKLKHTMALAAMMVLTLASGALAQEAQPTATAAMAKPEKYKDWDLFCPKPQAANAPQVCEIRTVILSDKGQRLGALVVAAQVGGGGKDVIASALLPLGVDLTQQPSLSVGSSKIELKYLRCLQRGCEAITALSADQQAMLQLVGGKFRLKFGVDLPSRRAAVVVVLGLRQEDTGLIVCQIFFGGLARLLAAGRERHGLVVCDKDAQDLRALFAVDVDQLA